MPRSWHVRLLNVLAVGTRLMTGQRWLAGLLSDQVDPLRLRQALTGGQRGLEDVGHHTRVAGPLSRHAGGAGEPLHREGAGRGAQVLDKQFGLVRGQVDEDCRDHGHPLPLLVIDRGLEVAVEVGQHARPLRQPGADQRAVDLPDVGELVGLDHAVKQRLVHIARLRWWSDQALCDDPVAVKQQLGRDEPDLRVRKLQGHGDEVGAQRVLERGAGVGHGGLESGAEDLVEL